MDHFSGCVHIVEREACAAMRPLAYTVQNYAWGSLGHQSTVAQLYTVANQRPVDEKMPYAELWLGTHVNGPSRIASQNHKEQLLEDYLGQPLPYLFKVLSIAKALSIQAHPDKALAEQLHAARPDIYKDDNHKPELAVALTKFQAMCGFRPHKEIAQFIHAYPEFRNVIGHQNAANFVQVINDNADISEKKQALQQLFTSLMTADPDFVKIELQSMIQRISEEQRSGDVDSLLLMLAAQYPGDVGVFSALVLNHVILEVGQALFLGPNVPHAYLSGDCIECMACSDNVVRAGLTPKLRDVEVLCSMLTYESGFPNLQPEERFDDFITYYRPPTDEFQLMMVHIPQNSSYVIPEFRSTAIILIVEGTGNLDEFEVSAGSAMMVTPNHKVNVHSEHSLRMFCCYAP